jgi:hypothetical protein
VETSVSWRMWSRVGINRDELSIRNPPPKDKFALTACPMIIHRVFLDQVPLLFPEIWILGNPRVEDGAEFEQ